MNRRPLPSMPRVATLVATLAVTAIGCSDTSENRDDTGGAGGGNLDSGELKTVADFCTALAATQCDLAQHCCEDAGVAFDRDACLSARASDCSSTYTPTAYHSTLGDQCVAEQETLADCAYVPSELEACFKLSHPADAAPGAACSSTGECSSSSTEAGVCTDGTCIRVAFTQKGQPCDQPNSICRDGLSCRKASLTATPTCEPLSATGAACSASSMCESGLCDLGTGLCAEAPVTALCPR